MLVYLSFGCVNFFTYCVQTAQHIIFFLICWWIVKLVVLWFDEWDIVEDTVVNQNKYVFNYFLTINLQLGVVYSSVPPFRLLLYKNNLKHTSQHIHPL